MKLKSLLAAGLFAAATALSFGAQAAADADKAPAAEAQADKASAKKAKPHSHVEEKTGVPQKAPQAKAEKPNPAKDTSKHYHPRDMK